MVPDVRKSVLRAGVYSTNESVFHSSQAAKIQHRLGAANCRFLNNWSTRDIHRLSAFLRLVCGYAKQLPWLDPNEMRPATKVASITVVRLNAISCCRHAKMAR